MNNNYEYEVEQMPEYSTTYTVPVEEVEPEADDFTMGDNYEYELLPEYPSLERNLEAAREKTDWPSWLGKYGRLGVKGSDPRVYDKGEAVELLLSRAGWKGDEFTEEFANEVKQIQEENNLIPTGRADQKTWNIIVNK